MPRTTGTYAAPANSVNPAVAGTNIDASDFNALVDDLETALTESVYTSGLGATDNRLVRTDGTDTKKLQSTGITVDDSNNMNGVTSITLAGGGALRDVLSANRTYYVRTDGSDSNTGLANTAGGAFLTIQKALNVAASLDISIYDVTIEVADGTYTAGGVVSAPWVGSGNVYLSGNVASPQNCIISTTSANCLRVTGGGRLQVRGFEFRTTTGGNCLVADIGGSIQTNGVVHFGACAVWHINADTGGYIRLNANYTISGGASIHAIGSSTGVLEYYSITITLTGTPNFSAAFGYVNALGVYKPVGCTFSGSATGTRYIAVDNGVILTSGGGATYLPGNAGGATASGGQYS
jgi:hypothetical protein